MKPAYLTLGMRAGVLARLVARHGVTPAPRYLSRLAYCSQAATWASLMARLERRRTGDAVDAAPAALDPVIIPSHWRTGTTILHQLMARDPALTCPTMFQVAMPDSFLSSRPYAEPLLGPAMRGTRPMDNVRVGFDEPQEDEYALYRLTGDSPLTRLVFPRGDDHFLAGDETFLPDAPEQRRLWERALVRFVTRLQLQAGGRRVVLKNPFHALRISTLLRLFPGAKFLHIRRDPMAVIPSTVRMWRIMARDNALRAGGRAPSFEEVVALYGQLTRKLEADLDALPPRRVARLRFEDLELRPRGALRAAYHQIGLDYTHELDRAVQEFVEQHRDYQKNRHELTPEQQELIRAALPDLMSESG